MGLVLWLCIAPIQRGRISRTHLHPDIPINTSRQHPSRTGAMRYSRVSDALRFSETRFPAPGVLGN
jgi:hypothetical protein